MSDLEFTVLDIAPQAYALSPLLDARLRIEERTGEVVHAAALRCQIRIEPQRRPYTDDEADALFDQFGARGQWSKTLRPFLWTHCATVVQGFTGSTEVSLPISCTYDFEVAASRYLSVLGDGSIPLVFLFNGTVFTRGSLGFEVHQIGWHCEASYAMPVATWQALRDLHFPHSAWMRLDRDTLDALQLYKATHGLLSWDDTMRTLLERATDPQALT